MATAQETTLRCSFCGKSQHEVRKLIAGPDVCICDECVRFTSEIIKEEDAISGMGPDPTPASGGTASTRDLLSAFSDYLRGKYPDEEVTVSIVQSVGRIRMTIEGASGGLEVVEQSSDGSG